MRENDTLFSKISLDYEFSFRKELTPVHSFIHFHSLYEIYLLDSGEREYLINGEILHAKQGSVVIIKPGVLHETTGTAFSRRIIHFNEDFLLQAFNEQYIDSLLDKIETGVYLIQEDDTQNLDYNFKLAEKNYIEKNTDGFAICAVNIINIILKSATKSNSTPSNSELIENTIKYLQNNYQNEITLDEISKALFVSKYHLCHAIKQEKHTTVFELLKKVRLEKASELLVMTNEKIKDISEACGFNSEYYFCNVFKNELGFSPIKYRQILKKKK